MFSKHEIALDKRCLERCTFKKWFCGHYHQNLTVEDRYILLYDELRPLETADTVSGT